MKLLIRIQTLSRLVLQIFLLYFFTIFILDLHSVFIWITHKIHYVVNIIWNICFEGTNKLYFLLTFCILLMFNLVLPPYSLKIKLKLSNLFYSVYKWLKIVSKVFKRVGEYFDPDYLLELLEKLASKFIDESEKIKLSTIDLVKKIRYWFKYKKYVKYK